MAELTRDYIPRPNERLETAIVVGDVELVHFLLEHGINRDQNTICLSLLMQNQISIAYLYTTEQAQRDNQIIELLATHGATCQDTVVDHKEMPEASKAAYQRGIVHRQCLEAIQGMAESSEYKDDDSLQTALETAEVAGVKPDLSTLIHDDDDHIFTSVLHKAALCGNKPFIDLLFKILPQEESVAIALKNASNGLSPLSATTFHPECTATICAHLFRADRANVNVLQGKNKDKTPLTTALEVVIKSQDGNDSDSENDITECSKNIKIMAAYGCTHTMPPAQVASLPAEVQIALKEGQLTWQCFIDEEEALNALRSSNNKENNPKVGLPEELWLDISNKTLGKPHTPQSVLDNVTVQAAIKSKAATEQKSH